VAVINSAYNTLEEKGMIVRKDRSGIIVNPRIVLDQTKLLALITNYKQNDIENYYDPLFSITGSRRIVPMIGAPGKDWQQNIKDLVARKPNYIMVDVEARYYPLEMVKPLFGTAPVCYCNRWEWFPEKPQRAVLTDYAWAFAEALRLLRERGHKRIVIIGHHSHPQPHLIEFLRQAKFQAGFTEKDPLLLNVSHEQILKKPSEFSVQFKKFKPTAVFGLSDYLVDLLVGKCPAASGLEKIGLFDQKYSQPSNGNFTSFRIDFAKIWEAAIASFAENAENVTYIKPELVRRGN